jgi:hypothetical protein
MNQVGNSKFPPSGHLIFVCFTNIRNENKTREIQKWPRARDRTSLIPLRCVFLYKLNVTRFVPTGFVNHTEECK